MSLVALTAAQEGSGEEDLGIGARAFSAGNRNRGQAAAAAANDASDGERMGFNFGGNNNFGGFDYGNYANYDLSGYDYGFDANAGRPGADVASDDRYFFTQPPQPVVTATPPPTTLPKVLGSSCWKCDAMTFTQCAAEGQYEECRLGDLDCCFIEVRATDQKLQQLCTGCKDYTACKDNMYENFNGRYDNDEQCRPEFIQQRYRGRHGGTQSVCRQCFKTCNPGDYMGAFCFGGVDGNNPVDMFGFSVPFLSAPNLLTIDLSVEWQTPRPDHEYHHYPFDSDFTMGIPTWIPVDESNGKSAQFLNNIATTASNFFFGHMVTMNPDGTSDFQQNVDSKAHSSDGTADKFEVADMTYWSVLTGDREWWQSDLKMLQDRYWVLDEKCTPSTTAGFIWDDCPGTSGFWGEIGGFDGTGATITPWLGPANGLGRK